MSIKALKYITLGVVVTIVSFTLTACGSTVNAHLADLVSAARFDDILLPAKETVQN